MSEKEHDAVTGTETTGHVWDGIKELNTPLPKWWVYVLYASIIWAIGYWVVYPAWPGISGYTRGMFGYSSHGAYYEEAAAAKEAQKVWLDKIAAASLDQINSDAELVEFAQNGGRAVFAENCAPCHGAGGQGAPGFPVLADDSWLWGGDLAAIEQTIRFGIRSAHPDTRVSEMPRFGADQVLDSAQIGDVADYVLSLSGTEVDAGAKERGGALYVENCAACHGEKGEGVQDMGGPRLSDGIWLYGGDRKTVVETITYARRGNMPAWVERLDPATVKVLATYVHALGGGQ